jgi:hypothetical protein
VDGISTFGVVHPCDHQPSAGKSLPDDETGVAFRLGDLHALVICEYLLDLVLAELPFGMLLNEMLTVGGVPSDRPVVHTEVYSLCMALDTPAPA